MMTFIVGFVVGIIVIFLIYMTWFPKTNRFRVHRKLKGRLTYYRPEAYRPFFGWSPFYASKSRGEIRYYPDWTNEERFCKEYIQTYKDLRNI